MRCLPAAVSQSQGTVLEALKGIAGTTVLVALLATTSGMTTAATLALTLAVALPLLPSVLGGGPSYLLVSEWRNAHDLALHEPYA